MDFVKRLRERDDEVFVGLCYIFYTHLRRVHDQDRFGEFQCVVPDAPYVKAIFTRDLDTTKVLFQCVPTGRSFRLAGEVFSKTRRSLHSTEPSKRVRDLYFTYLAEHSRLLDYRDFDEEQMRKGRRHFNSEDREDALDKWMLDVERQNEKLNAWWADIETTEILARVAA